jgi:hypothetical protein
MGFCVLVRPALAPLTALGVAYAVVQLTSKQRKPLLATGVCLLVWVALPGAWVARNALTFGSPALTSIGGQMMSWNHAKLEVLSRGGDELELMRQYNRTLPPDADLAPLDDPRALGGVPIGEKDELRYAAAITKAQTHAVLEYPLPTVVRALAVSAATYLLGYSRGDLRSVGGPVAARVAQGVWWSTLLLACASPFLSQDVRRQWPSLLLMAAALVLLFAPTLFIGYSRYRLPSDPILCVLAGVTLSHLARRTRALSSHTGGPPLAHNVEHPPAPDERVRREP